MRRLIILGTLILLAKKFVRLLAYFTLPLRWFKQFFKRYHPCRWCLRCCAYWQNLKPFYRRLIINMLVGLTITLLLVTVQDNRFLHEAEDIGIDWVIKMFRNTPPTQDSPPFVLLDIDEKTYQHWQEPLLTPRDKLLDLLKFAVGGQPKVIVVDIDLSYPIERSSHKLNLADHALSDFFAQYEVHCSKTGCPHILLARTFRQSLEDNGYDLVRPAFLDSVVANSPHVHWASTSFDLSRDSILRRWRLWEVSCSGQFPVVVPSMQLLTVALLNNPTQGACQIANKLAAVMPVDCEGDNLWTAPAWHDTMHVNSNLQLDFSPSRLSRRIIYTIPWKLPKGESRPLTRQGSPVLSTLSAYKITEHAPIDSTLLRDTITIIGGSFKESRDIYATPLGWMPGVLVIANAIHSLLQFGELTPPPLWAIVLIQALFIFIMSLAFALFSSFFGMLISGVVIIIVMVPFSFWLFEYGVWLDFAIALVIVQLNEMAMAYRELLQMLDIKEKIV
jgi:CHASE2 domain-containing sensor protein